MQIKEVRIAGVFQEGKELVQVVIVATSGRVRASGHGKAETSEGARELAIADLQAKLETANAAFDGDAFLSPRFVR